MIARLWYGTTRAADADAYVLYVHQTGVIGQRATPGNLGSLVLRRTRGERAEFLVLSLWESLDAIKAFAGDRHETAVYYPEDDRFLLERTPDVEHYEIVAGVVEPLSTGVDGAPV